MNQYKIYGIYRNIRNASWQCLIDYGMDSLPVDLLAIVKAANIKLVKNSDVYELSPYERGISLYDEGQWYIIYADEDIIQKKRFTIAHELGHILLGHEMKASKFVLDEKSEAAADDFALRLLAPACVLWGLDLHDKAEIAQVCNICVPAAHRRAERMKILYRREKFLTSPLEQRLYKQFENYVIQNKRQE